MCNGEEAVVRRGAYFFWRIYSFWWKGGGRGDHNNTPGYLHQPPSPITNNQPKKTTNNLFARLPFREVKVRASAGVALVLWLLKSKVERETSQNAQRTVAFIQFAVGGARTMLYPDPQTTFTRKRKKCLYVRVVCKRRSNLSCEHTTTILSLLVL